MSLEEIVNKATIYGKKEYLQPALYIRKPTQDAILVMQIGIHAFVVLYYSARKLAIVADGANLYATDELAKTVIESEFTGEEVVNIPFYGQNRTNRCASSAVAIVLEFQKIHRSGEVPKEVRPTKVMFERLNQVLHKVDTPVTTGWQPINTQKIGVTCDKCGKHYRNAKNRNVLNKHKC